MFHKILVANDGSEGAKKALSAAIYLARLSNAQLHTISVEEDLPKYIGTINEFDEVKRQRDEFFDTLIQEATQEAHRHGVTLHSKVLAGHEVETIVNYAQEGKFDLLVIGFAGHSNIFGRIWGSTSQTLTRLSPCTVMVVR